MLTVSYRRWGAEAGGVAAVQLAIKNLLPPEVPPAEPWAELHLRVPRSSSDKSSRPKHQPFVAPCSASVPEALVCLSGSFWKVLVPALTQLARQTTFSGSLSPPVCTPIPTAIADSRLESPHPQNGTEPLLDVTCFDGPLAGAFSFGMRAPRAVILLQDRLPAVPVLLFTCCSQSLCSRWRRDSLSTCIPGDWSCQSKNP
jgi:hypothetical protein